MDFELLEKAGMTKYEMAKNDPFCFFMRSIVAGLYLGLATYFLRNTCQRETNRYSSAISS